VPTGGYQQMVSHRSGDGGLFIADLAVGTGCGQLKSGAGPRRASRQYNHLVEIAGAARRSATEHPVCLTRWAESGGQ
jgi:enolase